MCSLAAALWLANDRHFYHFNVSAQLWIVEGTPLLPGQHSLRVSYFLGTPAPAVTEADAVAEDPGISLQFMADLIVTPETTTAELKRMIVEQFPTVRIPRTVFVGFTLLIVLLANKETPALLFILIALLWRMR